MNLLGIFVIAVIIGGVLGRRQRRPEFVFEDKPIVRAGLIQTPNDSEYRAYIERRILESMGVPKRIIGDERSSPRAAMEHFNRRMLGKN